MPRHADLTDAAVRAVKPPTTGRLVIPDGKVRGLLLRVTSNGHRSWWVRFRLKGKGRDAAPQLVGLGAYPGTTLTKAREDAALLLVAVTAGADPVADRAAKRAKDREKANETPEQTVADVAPRWLASVQAKRSKSTHRNYTTAMVKHIIPPLGMRRVADLKRRDVAALHEAMRDVPIQANRTLAALGVFCAWCEREGHRPPRSSPVYGIEKYPELQRRRFLSTAELGTLGAVLTRAEREGLEPSPAMKAKAGGQSTATKAKAGTRPARGPYVRKAPPRGPAPADPFAVGALRLMLLTGWRLQEVVALEWEHVDLHNRSVYHPTTKAGSTDRALSAPAAALLSGLPRVQGSPWVFPSPRDASRHVGKPVRLWDAVRLAAGLDHVDKKRRVMAHDIRHSVGAALASSGASLPVIAALLGHRQTRTTERYAHLSIDARHEAIDRATGQIAAALAAGADADVLPITSKRRAKGA